MGGVAPLVAGADVSSGAMIALAPRDAESLAVGNEPADQLHVTLSYLGKIADLSPEAQAKILDAADELSRNVPLKVKVLGPAFLNDECTVILVDSPELRDLYDDVIKMVGTKSTFPGYTPHMTVDYGDKLIDVGDLPDEIELITLRVAFGGEVTDFDGLAVTAGMFDSARHAVGKAWDAAMHPRARDGRFIEVGGYVRGSISFRTKDGKYEVRPRVLARVTRVEGEVIHVRTRDGEPGIAFARTLDQAIAPKADLRGATIKHPVVQLSPEERFKSLVKAMADDAAKLPDDPEGRIAGLNKIMGGLRGSPLTTAYRHNKRGPSLDEWSDDRIVQHENLWDHLLERIESSAVGRDRRALVLGGPPGAGKSFSLKPGEPAGELGVVGWDLTGDPPPGATHVVMNPDVIKELMIEHGMMPDYIPADIRPREAASVAHAESNFLTMLFMSRLAALDINTVYDSTMANHGHVEKNIRSLAESGYTFQGLYVKIPKNESAESARRRYIEDSLLDPVLGGRFVPAEASSAWDTEATFKGFRSWFTDGWLMLDNTGLTKGHPRKEVYEEGVGDGLDLSHFLTPMPPAEFRPKPPKKPKTSFYKRKPAARFGNPKSQLFWLDPGYQQPPSEPDPGKLKPVMWKPGMRFGDVAEGVGDAAGGEIIASAIDNAPYTDTQAAIGMSSGALDPDRFLELLRQNMILVTPSVEDEDDYLWATTVFHELNRRGRGGLSYEVGDEYNRLRSEGFTRDTDNALTAAAWDPLLHPRGKDGQFIRINSWIRGTFRLIDGDKSGKSTGKINAKVSHFQPSGDPAVPFVIVHTPDGSAIAAVNTVVEAASPKASLSGPSSLRVSIDEKRVELQSLLPDGKPFGEFGIEALYGPDKKTVSPQMSVIEQKSTEMGAMVDDEVLKRLGEQNIGLLTPDEWTASMGSIHQQVKQLAFEHGMIRQSLEDKSLPPGPERTMSGVKAIEVDPAGMENLAKQKALAQEALRVDNNRHIYRSAYSTVLREVLDELVDGGLGGPAKVSYWKANDKTVKDHQIVMGQSVEAVYPSSWIAASNNYKLPVSIDVNPKRAQYNPKTGEMRLYPRDSPTTGQVAVHEFAHRMEEVVPGLKPLEFAFYWRRVGNEPKFAMAPNEYTRADEFPTMYMGKDYGAGMLSNFELFSVGAEVLLAPKSAKGSMGVRGLLEDKDYRSWLIGSMITLTGPQARTSKKLTLQSDLGSPTVSWSAPTSGGRTTDLAGHTLRVKDTSGGYVWSVETYEGEVMATGSNMNLEQAQATAVGVAVGIMEGGA